MIFNKGLIFKILDNKINIIDLRQLNNNELKILINALKFNSSLKELNLSNNKITDITPLFKSLKNNNCLKKINLSFNEITDLTPFKKYSFKNSRFTF